MRGTLLDTPWRRKVPMGELGEDIWALCGTGDGKGETCCWRGAGKEQMLNLGDLEC